MSSKIQDELKKLDNKQLKKEILVTRNQLFELRFKKATRQPFESHSFSQLKYKLRLLLMFQNPKNAFREKM